MNRLILLSVLTAACAAPARPFPLREPMLVDDDTRSVSLPCTPDPSKDEPNRMRCAPAEYVSPFLWEQFDNLVFRRISSFTSGQVTAEAVNVNSMDEVPDSSWFTNRATLSERDDGGACKPDDVLPGPDEVEPGTWVIDHGKDNGATRGFRITVPGKGKFMMKADEPTKPERASAGSIVGAAVYSALGFNSTCEQIVLVRKDQFKLEPGLEIVENTGLVHPFDSAELDRVLASTTQEAGGTMRFQASKWLPGITLGPFRYRGMRADDPNDVIEHADRRELRASRLIAAWLDHWDAREQNSMDVWLADSDKDKRSSPGHVVHYIIDTSDIFGEELGIDDMSRRLGHSYNFDAGDILRSFFSLGMIDSPWDRAAHEPGLERFGYFSLRDFDPEKWKPWYPNAAFVRMTERDGAWMARKLARFSDEDVRKFAALGKWSRPVDYQYVSSVLIGRLHKILRRYLSKVSPLGDVHVEKTQEICATDFARMREIFPGTIFGYTVIERSALSRTQLTAVVGAEGRVCFAPRSLTQSQGPDGDPSRRVEFVVWNGTSAKPLAIHAYDLGARGMKIVGLTRD